MGNTKWRSEPTDVERSADELWLGEKFQSNSELAGSPRNALRRSGNDELPRGKATVSIRAAKAVPSRGKLRILGICFPLASETVGDKLHCQEGKSPDHQLRPLNGR